MFSQANWLVNVKSVEIGESADASAGAAAGVSFAPEELLPEEEQA